MATVTKPIALDESFNTTELTPRNIADVLADGFSHITGRTASEVEYDNSGSGLSATDVQNAIDELSSEKADSSSLATVATSGDYDDLINKPTIPTVNDATLTIQKNGSDVATFTANASSNVTANVTVPTTTSELTNNSDFVSDASYVHTDNNFTNAEKTKLGGIESGAEVNVQSDWNEDDNTKDDYIKNKPSSEVKSTTDIFTTVNGGLLEECNIELEPVQDLHGYDNPWVGGAGKNLAYMEQGTLDMSTGVEVTSTTRVRTNYIPVVPESVYIASSQDNNWAIRNGCVYDANKNFIASQVYPDPSNNRITIPSNAYYLRLVYSHGDTSETCTPNDYWYQFELGSTATDYEPYSNICPISGHTEVDLDVKDGDNVTQQTYQVQIGSTVYGGYVDLVSGVMTVDRKYKKGFTRGATDSSGKLYKIDELSDAVNVTSGQKVADLDESNMGIFLGLDFARASTDFCLSHYTISFYVGGMIGKETELDALLPNLEIVYELATPQTIQLTPQQIEALVGQNNLSCPLDGQSIQTNGVEYREVFAFDDVEKVVSLRVPISMLGTDESGRTTASQAYASGDYFYKDGYMCKALTSISAGATLTLNTNYSQGTLADILKAIENA